MGNTMRLWLRRTRVLRKEKATRQQGKEAKSKMHCSLLTVHCSFAFFSTSVRRNRSFIKAVQPGSKNVLTLIQFNHYTLMPPLTSIR